MKAAYAPSVMRIVWDLNLEDAVVVVEGKRDAAALRSLGFTGTIMLFHRYGGFARFSDVAAAHRRLILLLDYDRKGSYMTRRLVQLLQRRTKVDLSYRRRLYRVTRGQIRFVEQLMSLGPQAAQLKGFYHPPDGHGHGGSPHVHPFLNGYVVGILKAPD